MVAGRPFMTQTSCSQELHMQDTARIGIQSPGGKSSMTSTMTTKKLPPKISRAGAEVVVAESGGSEVAAPVVAADQWQRWQLRPAGTGERSSGGNPEGLC